MTVLPSFNDYPDELATIARMVLGYSEIELLFCRIAGMAIKKQDEVIKAAYRIRTESGRLDLIDALARGSFAEANVEPVYSAALGCMRCCLTIRNQYAHTHFASDPDHLFFVSIDTEAKKTGALDLRNFRHTTLAILREQEAYFVGTREQLFYLEWCVSSPGRANPFPKPAAMLRPTMHTPPDQAPRPTWIPEDP